MSEISSTSELTTKEIVEQAIQDYHMSILPYLAKSNNGYSDTPIGAIQLFDDDTAPSGWLVADGTVYNISDYPFLASHYERVHGSKNHYGGDGVTTFAVPDWRGEFFRASGPNAHPNQGDGAAVGEHQDGTITPQINVTDIGNVIIPTNSATTNIDSIIESKGMRYFATTGLSDTLPTITSRPTCTSGLCCIKAVPAGINYSLEEQEIGTWLGEKLYQKVIIHRITSESTSATIITTLDSDVSVINVDGILILDSGYRNIINSALNSYYFNIIEIDNNNELRYYLKGWYPCTAYITLQYTKTTD